jgi:hypothetical protein
VALNAAVAKFHSANTDRERWLTYERLIESLSEAGEVATQDAYARYRNEAAETLTKRMRELERAAREMEKTLAARPEKPKYDPPGYHGAFYLRGVVKKCYSDGVALRSGPKYYFVHDAMCPNRSQLEGYVEESILGNMQMDLGRDGRESNRRRDCGQGDDGRR